MPLTLQLKPHERVILGGAVVCNGRSRARLVIENEVPVLRESDILSPRLVRTPCQRIDMALQLLYLDPARLSPTSRRSGSWRGRVPQPRRARRR